MERTEFEELVRRALLDMNYREYLSVMAEADTIAYNPSQRYLDWEKEFLEDPFGYASGLESTGETNIELEVKNENEPRQEDDEG